LSLPIRSRRTARPAERPTGSAGIITPPSGGDTEKFEYIPLSATSNQFGAVNSPITLTFEVWYDLPSLRKESVVTLSYSLVDNDGTSFQRVVDFKVAP
jgi:hypothetical protein